jgi:phosphonate transport system substrate-binding protein
MKRHMLPAGFALIIAAAVLVIPSGSAGQLTAERSELDGPTVLVFSGIPSGSVTLLESWQPLLKMLEKETHLEIRVLSAPSYKTVIEGLKNNQIDIAALGPLTYVAAKDAGAQITAVAAKVQEKGESPTYRSNGFTWAGSPISSIEDFRGKKVCFVDNKSTSGFLYPRAKLIEVGIEPADIQPIFAGSHDASVLAVANRQCDAGFAFERMVERQAIDQGKIHPGQIVTVWKSELIPDGPIVVSDRLPPELRQRLMTTIQEKANADYQRAQGFCQGECPIGDTDAYGYAPVEDQLYDSVRLVCKLTQHEVCKGQ